MIRPASQATLARVLEKPYRAAPLPMPAAMFPSLPQQLVTDIRQAVTEGRMTPEDAHRAIRALRR